MLADALATLAAAGALVALGYGICRLTHDHQHQPVVYLLPGSTRRPHPSTQRRRPRRAAHPTVQRRHLQVVTNPTRIYDWSNER